MDERVEQVKALLRAGMTEDAIRARIRTGALTAPPSSEDFVDHSKEGVMPFLSGVGESLAGSAKGALNAIAHPIDTLTALPGQFASGIGHAIGQEQAAEQAMKNASNLREFADATADMAGRSLALPVDVLTGGTASRIIDRGQEALGNRDMEGLGRAAGDTAQLALLSPRVSGPLASRAASVVDRIGLGIPGKVAGKLSDVAGNAMDAIRLRGQTSPVPPFKRPLQLTAGAIQVPPGPDASFVRGVPAQYPMSERLALPAPPEVLADLPPSSLPDASFVRSVPGTPFGSPRLLGPAVSEIGDMGFGGDVIRAPNGAIVMGPPTDSQFFASPRFRHALEAQGEINTRTAPLQRALEEAPLEKVKRARKKK